MKRLISRALVLVVLVIGSAVPASAWDESCKECDAYYDAVEGRAVVECRPAYDDDMGYWGCNVTCGDGSCQCVQDGPPIYCMTIVVNG